MINAALLITCIPQYITAYRTDKQQNELLHATLEATKDIQAEDSVILTNLEYLDWTVLDYYYPEAQHVLFTDSIPELNEGSSYWLMLPDAIGAELTKQLQTQGFIAEMVVENGSLGTNPVVVCKINYM